MPYFLSLASPAAEGTTAAGQEAMGSGSIVYTLVMLVLMIVVFYFLLIRPQKKKEKAAKALRDSMQIGDEVTTIGGITGIVTKLTEDTVVIETGGDRSKIRVKKWAISENATVHDDSQETLVK
jgi:preprotein translocase subunit YajC